MTDQQTLKAMRISVLVFTPVVLAYAITMQGQPRSMNWCLGAYQVPLVGAFVPLVCGLYWKRATTQGALLAVVSGLGVWLTLLCSCPGSGARPSRSSWPACRARSVGMVFGSLAPQYIANEHEDVVHYQVPAGKRPVPGHPRWRCTGR